VLTKPDFRNRIASFAETIPPLSAQFNVSDFRDTFGAMSPNSLGSPSTESEVCQQLMLATYKSVVPDGNAIYCSGAITSGKIGLNWLKSNGLSSYEAADIPVQLRESFQTDVIDRNVRELRFVASSLRATTGRPVIDPSALPHING
jgi:hypothetical protein